ncbi:MAG: MoxR family ATPase [Lachnospiraceae bacterium]|nr:MoxR family ATPase [Lachnospiraceae bacterium]
MDKTDIINRLREQTNEYFVGKEGVVEDVLVCLLAGGHILLEDVPGVGKTTLARTIARLIDCSFARIQFTPDTLPGDITGLSVYNMKTGDFEFREGVIMHQMILADEINRTSPKTQAALLEAMAEGRVTVDGISYDLVQPFMVIATQNPVEFLGTYPLPEAQMDRFMMRLTIGYPDASSEIRMASNHIAKKTVEDITSICSASDIIGLRQETAKVHFKDILLGYAQQIVASTRNEKRFVTGASPRAYLSLVDASRAKALLSGRDYVTPDDIKAVAVNVLHHRLTLTSEARIRKDDIDRIITENLLAVKIPME